MGNIIIVLILIVAVILGIRGSVQHMKGEGGCCGGGDSVKREKAPKLEQVLETKIITIEGMTCDNCRNRVENALNSIDGVSAKVNLKKKEAIVQLGKRLDEADLRIAVERSGYHVVKIETA